MLRSHGISQIYHTLYPPLYRGYIPLGYTPKSNHGSGAYPPRRDLVYPTKHIKKHGRG